MNPLCCLLCTALHCTALHRIACTSGPSRDLGTHSHLIDNTHTHTDTGRDLASQYIHRFEHFVSYYSLHSHHILNIDHLPAVYQDIFLSLPDLQLLRFCDFPFSIVSCFTHFLIVFFPLISTAELWYI